MSDPGMASFREVRIEDRPLLQPLLLAAGKISCDYNFANLYSWQEIYGICWALHRERLIIYGMKDDVALMPVGAPFTPEELAELSDGFIRQGRSGTFVIVAAEYVERHARLREYFTAEVDPDNADYIYSSRALVELRGNRLHKKKNLVSQFRRANPRATCRPMDRESARDCFMLAEKWCEEKNCETIGFTHERSALKRAFDKFDELGLEGLVLRDDGRLVAFSIFSRQNAATAAVHFEKYDPAIKGSAQAMNWETARHLAGVYEYINREQDLGIEGLRRAKRSYCPLYTVKVCTLRRRA